MFDFCLFDFVSEQLFVFVDFEIIGGLFVDYCIIEIGVVEIGLFGVLMWMSFVNLGQVILLFIQ